MDSTATPKDDQPSSANDGSSGSTQVSQDPRVERTRGRALQAARTILVEEGWDALTQNHLAEASGIGRATIYRHWPDRISLLRAVLGAESSGLTLSVPLTGELRHDLVATLDVFCRDLVERNLGQVLSALVDRAERDLDLQQLMVTLLHDSLSFVRESLQRAVIAGELCPALNVEYSLSELFGPIIYRRLLSREPLTWEFVRAVVDDFLAAHHSGAN
jgi:AcrR family transcriptional regulator